MLRAGRYFSAGTFIEFLNVCERRSLSSLFSWLYFSLFLSFVGSFLFLFSFSFSLSVVLRLSFLIFLFFLFSFLFYYFHFSVFFDLPFSCLLFSGLIKKNLSKCCLFIFSLRRRFCNIGNDRMKASCSDNIVT